MGPRSYPGEMQVPSASLRAGSPHRRRSGGSGRDDKCGKGWGNIHPPRFLRAAGKRFGKRRGRRGGLLFAQLQFSLLLVCTDLLLDLMNLPLQRLVGLFAGVVDLKGHGVAGAGFKSGRDGENRSLLFGRSHRVVGFGIEIDSGLKTELALKLGIFLKAGALTLLGAGRGRFTFLIFLVLMGCLHLGDAQRNGGGLLDGVEHKPGGAVVELAGGKCLNNLAESDTHGVKVLQRREDELSGLVPTLGKSKTQAASALHDVVIAVFSAAQGGRGAIGSVFFNVATSFERHKARFLSWGTPYPSAENKGFIAALLVSSS